MFSIFMIVFLTVFIILLSTTYILLVISFLRVYQILFGLLSYMFFFDFPFIWILLYFQSRSEGTHAWLCVCVRVCACLYIKWSFPIKKILNMYALAPHGFIPNHTCSPFRFFSHAKCLIKMVRVVRKWVGDVAAWNMICCPTTFFSFYIMSLCAPSSLDFSLLSDQKTLITLHKAM